MRQKVLTIVQDIDRAQEHEWVVKYINPNLVEMHFALINSQDSMMDQFLRNNNIPVTHFSYTGKKDLLTLTFKLIRLIQKNRYDVVHTHLFEASLTGLTAAWAAGIKKRIYTRHHSDYHHVWFPSAVKYDKYVNRIASHIIATSKNVKNILTNLEQVPEHKIHIVHHCIDIRDYEPGAVSPERISTIRVKYKIEDKVPVIGVISRFTKWKGIQYLIPAFHEILNRYPEAVLVLANAKGDYKANIVEQLKSLKPDQYRVIEFENDITALYRTFDVFVHTPINPTAEAFGQTYLESLASKVPSVFTLSGVAPEFVVDKINAMVVPFCDSNAVKEAVLYLLQHKEEGKKLSEEGFVAVRKLFDINIKIGKLEQLYTGFDGSVN